MSELISSVAAPREMSRQALELQGQATEENETIHAAFAKNRLRWDNVDWVVTIFLIGVHSGALIAPFFFSWAALVTCLAFHWFTCSIGICLGYHRYLAHKSFKLRAPAKFMVLLAGSLSAEGSPLTWAATHRLHHHKSACAGDPHSPLEGPWWSHLLWLFLRRKDHEQMALHRRYAPELVNDRMLVFFERSFAFLLWGQGFVLLGIGALMGGWPMALSMLLWGMCVRMVVAYHSTWFVNSATHLWGYRNYDTRDESRNLWWVAVLSYGEGWHNNHHAYPAMAPAGHRWWEIDMTWWAIRALRALDLAYDVRDRVPQGLGGNEGIAESGVVMPPAGRMVG